MSINKYYHVTIDNNAFYISESSAKGGHTALETLKKIERILKHNLPYAKNRNDKFSELDPRSLIDLLNRISNTIKEGYNLKQAKIIYVAKRIFHAPQVNNVYSSIKNYLSPSRALPVPSDIVNLISDHLSLQDIAKLARTNRTGKTQASFALLNKARKAGFKGHNRAEAAVYLKELVEELRRSPLPEGLKKLSLEMTSDDIFELLESDKNAVQLVKCPKVITLLMNLPVSKNKNLALGASALVTVARYGNRQMLELLIRHGADPNLKVPYQSSALSHVVNKRDMDGIKYLLDQGAKIDFTSLAFACGGYFRMPNPEVLKLFLERGANPNMQNLNGHTPLHFATAKSGHPEIVKLLLDYGANPKIPNFKGDLPNVQ